MKMKKSVGLRPQFPEEKRIADIFRRLAAFRLDYDEAILAEIVSELRRTMSEDQADRIMSDAFLVDNELRFRCGGGVDLNEVGSEFATPDEEALVTLIGAVGIGGDFVAAVAAEKLGVDNHRVLLQAAALLQRSLGRGGIEIGWSVPAAPESVLASDMQIVATWH